MVEEDSSGEAVPDVTVPDGSGGDIEEPDRVVASVLNEQVLHDHIVGWGVRGLANLRMEINNLSILANNINIYFPRPVNVSDTAYDASN